MNISPKCSHDVKTAIHNGIEKSRKAVQHIISWMMIAKMLPVNECRNHAVKRCFDAKFKPQYSLYRRWQGQEDVDEWK